MRAPGELRHHAFGVHAAGQHVAMVAVGGDHLITVGRGHLHADHDRLLADIEMAEAADETHAVELRRLLLEAADQQHLAVGMQFLLAVNGGTVSWPLGRDMRFSGLAGEGKAKPYKKQPPKASHGQASAPDRRAGGRRHGSGRGGHDDPVAGAGKAQHLDGEFFDDVGIAGVEKAHVPLEARARGLEARDLRLQYSGAFDQPAARFEAAFTVDDMLGEIGQGTKADKRHQDLPGMAFTPIMHGGDAKPMGDSPDAGAA